MNVRVVLRFLAPLLSLSLACNLTSLVQTGASLEAQPTLPPAAQLSPTADASAAAVSQAALDTSQAAPGTPVVDESGYVSTCSAFQVPLGDGEHTLPPLPDEMELEIGAQAAAEIEQQYAVVSDSAVAERVARSGQAIVPYSDRPTLAYTFQVIVGEEVNAFALPGGFIYVSSGLLRFVESEAELAGVIAHEIAHVARCHGAQQIQLEAALIQRVRRAQQRRPDAAIFRNEREKLAAAMKVQVFEAGWSREQELEADEYGTIYMAHAGYDPQAIIDLFVRLDALTADPSTRIERLLATHPPFEVRIATVERTIAENALAQ